MAEGASICKWGCGWSTSDDLRRRKHEGRCSLRVSCPDCGARQREICRQPSGRRTKTHAGRQQVAVLEARPEKRAR